MFLPVDEARLNSGNWLDLRERVSPEFHRLWIVFRLTRDNVGGLEIARTETMDRTNGRDGMEWNEMGGTGLGEESAEGPRRMSMEKINCFLHPSPANLGARDVSDESREDELLQPIVHRFCRGGTSTDRRTPFNYR